MWETPDGFRTLNGPEAALVRLGVAALLIELDDVAEEGTRIERCVPIFDELTWQQQWALLSRVTNALLRSDVEAPQRCAIDDAMVAIIFRQIEAELAHEIECTDRNVIRRRMLGCVNLHALIPERSFNRNSTNVDDWHFLIDCVRDNILLDGDWALAEKFLDARRHISRQLKRELNIEDEYFIRPAPDPTEDEMPDIINGLDALVADQWSACAT